MADETQKLEQAVVFPENGAELHGTDGKEVVVHDDNGWHKELKEGDK